MSSIPVPYPVNLIGPDDLYLVVCSWSLRWSLLLLELLLLLLLLLNGVLLEVPLQPVVDQDTPPWATPSLCLA